MFMFSVPWMCEFTQEPWQMVTSGRPRAERTALRATSRTPDPKPSRRTVAKLDISRGRKTPLEG